MKAFLKLLLLLFHLAVFGAGGWYGWEFWLRHCALEEEKFALEAACAQLRAENARLGAESRRVAEAKDSLGRSLVSAVETGRAAQEACRRLEAENGRLKAEVADAGRGLREELRRRDEALRRASGDLDAAKARLRTQEADARAAAEAAARDRREAVEAALRRANDEPGADSLRELVELTDKAPRKAD